jgi:hypothetical protein
MIHAVHKWPDKQPSWTTENWLRSLRVAKILSRALLVPSQADHEHSLFGKHWGYDLPLEDSELERIKGLSPEDIASAVDSATELLKKELEEQVKELIQGGRDAELRAQQEDDVVVLQQQEVDAVTLNNKFAAVKGAFEFQFGGMDDYHGGLEGLIGTPHPDLETIMRYEHCDSTYAKEEFECSYTGEEGGASFTTACAQYKYVAYESTKEKGTQNGVRELGRDGWTLKDFMRKNSAFVKKAKITEVEVLALRLYTGPMYQVGSKCSNRSRFIQILTTIVFLFLHLEPNHQWYNTLLRRRRLFDEKDFWQPFDNYKKEWMNMRAKQQRQMTRQTSSSGASALLGFDAYKQDGYRAFPFRTTLHVLNSAIIKLGRISPAEKVYRGTQGGVLVRRLHVQQLPQIYTITNCCLPRSALGF